ncbi:MAG TPA: rRNA maturation RNase YbeY [Tepidiformaceae bacterium]|nr:rRNA maturation RNase YbeY [Tepidiformaceae bacterium]
MQSRSSRASVYDELPYDIAIEVAIEAPVLDVEALHRLADRIMAGENVEPGTSLAVLITGDDEIRRLNHQFLGIDEPTDVLSFPDKSDDFVQALSEEKLLGDIAISLPTARRQAAEVGHSLEAELAHLLTHGILHLCGYDHVTSPEDEARMRSREEHYLGDIPHHH